MACNGCQEKKEKLKDARAEWEKKALPTISKAIALLKKHGSPVADELLSLTAELNRITAIERQTRE